jgi:DnaK suppressor protein
MMDGILLQTVEGLGDARLVPNGCEIWELLQAEKEEVSREILAEGPIFHSDMGGLQETEASEDYAREIEWRHRSQLEARLRDINSAQDRLMDGSFGRCTDCGDEIDNRRLAADLAVSLCLLCQRNSEKEIVTYTL